MAEIALFDKSGRFVFNSTDPATLASLDDATRARIDGVRVAAGNLDDATAAVTQAEQQLRDTRAEIAAIEKSLPKMSSSDAHTALAKQFIADSNRRRAGL
jgi:hypothetical protein